jgi:hypothetical protein
MKIFRTLLSVAVSLLMATLPLQAQVSQLGVGEVIGNSTASRAPGQASSLTAMFNRAFTSTQGSILYRNATVWTPLAPGTSGLALVSGGAGGNPAYSILSLAAGGTNANLTASNGGIFYSTSSAGAILAGTATAGQIIRSGASAPPSWSTATYPATTTINRLLWSSATNVISDLATANNGVLVTSSGGVPSISSTLPSALTIPSPAFTGTATGAGTIPNAVLANSTISGTALGGALPSLTFGTHLTSGGSSYNGSGAVTITSDATNLNTVSTIVARDGSGNFSAGTITASLTGHASLDLPLTGGTLTGGIGFSTTNTLDIGTSATVLAPRTVYAGTSFVGPLVNATTGFQVNGAAASGNYLRGSGTNFVSSAIQAGDLPLATNAAIGGMRGDTTTITCTAGVCSALGGTATSVVVGTTTVSSGTDKFIFYQNGSSPSGVLGQYSVSGTTTVVPLIDEGSWTPAISATTTAGTPTYSKQVGRYEKVGRQVTARFTVALSGWTGSPSGQATISLPVASNATANNRGFCYVSNYNVSSFASGTGIMAFIEPGASVAGFVSNGSTFSNTISTTNAGTAFQVEGVCQYQT